MIQFYQGFRIKLGRDHNTKKAKYIGTYHGLRLTADTLTALKNSIDSRSDIIAEIGEQGFTAPRNRKTAVKPVQKLAANDDYELDDHFYSLEEAIKIAARYAAEHKMRPEFRPL